MNIVTLHMGSLSACEAAINHRLNIAHALIKYSLLIMGQATGLLSLCVGGNIFPMAFFSAESNPSNLKNKAFFSVALEKNYKN